MSELDFGDGEEPVCERESVVDYACIALFDAELK